MEQDGVVKLFSNSWHSKGKTISLLILVFLVLFPLIGDDYLIVMLTQFIIYGVFAMGLSLVWGYTGILCFGHAVFFGLGAYIMALATRHGRNAEWAEKAVREAVSLTAEEALAIGVIDLLAPSLEDLLLQVNGREVVMEG